MREVLEIFLPRIPSEKREKAKQVLQKLVAETKVISYCQQEFDNYCAAYIASAQSHYFALCAQISQTVEPVHYNVLNGEDPVPTCCGCAVHKFSHINKKVLIMI